jgi:hypothetical protein
MAVCTTNYVCTPVWYDATNVDVIAHAQGPHAVDLNITCFVGTGDVQIQVQDPDGNWFTPSESSYTILDSNLVRLPRANMPDMRIIATGNAKFAVHGSL